MRIRKVKFVGVAGMVAATVLAPVVAAAADYPVLRGSQTEDLPPTASEVFGTASANWGGFYLGGTAGLSSASFDPQAQSAFLSRMAFDNLITSPQGSPLLRFGKVSENKASYGAFIGYNYQFGDAVVGLEAEYVKTGLVTDQRGGISRLFTGIFPTTVPNTASTEPVNTQTTINVTGHTTTKLDDFAMLKARAGYAIGNFMPFINIGAAIGRISTNAGVTQSYSTVENYNLYNTRSTPDGSIVRTTFAGMQTMDRQDGRGSGRPTIVSSGYVPGLALGVGVDALLGEHFMLRAEYNRIYFSEYKGVNVVLDTARVGAGLKF